MQISATRLGHDQRTLWCALFAVALHAAALFGLKFGGFRAPELIAAVSPGGFALDLVGSDFDDPAPAEAPAEPEPVPAAPEPDPAPAEVPFEPIVTTTALNPNPAPLPAPRRELAAAPSRPKAAGKPAGSASAGGSGAGTGRGGGGGGNTQPSYLSSPHPPYPPESRLAREQGVVLLRVAVSAQGSPESVSIARSSGFARLDSAAVEGVRRWRFKPATENGNAVAAVAMVPVRFNLSPRG